MQFTIPLETWVPSSQLKHINLALLVRYCHVKQFGLDEILKPLIDDLKKLSSKGINVLVDGSEKKIFVQL